jgi:hypothetical protein
MRDAFTKLKQDPTKKKPSSIEPPVVEISSIFRKFELPRIIAIIQLTVWHVMILATNFREE